MSWLVPAAGFNPVGLPVQGEPFGSIPKPVSSVSAVAEKEGCQLSFQGGAVRNRWDARSPGWRPGLGGVGLAVARGLGQQVGDKGQG